MLTYKTQSSENSNVTWKFDYYYFFAKYVHKLPSKLLTRVRNRHNYFKGVMLGYILHL